jgi:starch-binding outer membrane protein, SusD/RagB family
MINPKRTVMKSTYKIIATGSLILFSVTSCLDDLDPKSLGPNSLNSATVYQTTGDFKSGLAKVYAAFSLSGQQGPAGNPDIINVDEGFATYLREYWNVQELPTDEAVYSWAEDGNIRPLHYQTWTPTNTFTGMMYTRILLAVTYANEFIRSAAASSDPEVVMFAAEARYLRALAYYHALDLFGNPSFVTEEDLPGAFFPEQISRANLFAYIESELTALEPMLGAPRFEYGRADKAALWMLQAKMYLNAQVYIGQAKYTECLTAVNKVIGAGYTLSPNYLANFRADNDTSPEMIFAFNYDARRSQSYGGMDYIIHGSIVGSMQPGDFGV